MVSRRARLRYRQARNNRRIRRVIITGWVIAAVIIASMLIIYCSG